MKPETKISVNLESLLNLGAQLNEANDDYSILNAVLLSLMGKLKIFRGAAYLPDSQTDFFNLIVFKGKKPPDRINSFIIESICELVKQADTKKQIELISLGYEICIPVIYRKELFAVICLSKKIDNSILSGEEYYYASLVSTISANAMNNARNIKLLITEKTIIEQRNQLLTTLFEVSRDFNIFLSREKIVKTLIYNLLGQLMISRFSIIYLEAETQNKLYLQKKIEEKIKHVVLHNTFKENLPDEYFDYLFQIKNTSIVTEQFIEEPLMEWFYNNGVEVISPMTVKGVPKGYLLIGKKSTNVGFTDENLLFIQVIGNTAILALENLKLLQIELEKQKIEKELSIALDIQKNLLPKSQPTIPGFDIYGVSIPTSQVGGDYYDFIELPNGNLLIAIADVAGKGMPAALLMANVQAALRVLAPMELSLDKILNRINNIVFINTSADRFVTFFCAELNPLNGDLNYINAGHNPPVFIHSDGSIGFLTEGGIILGVLDSVINYSLGSAKFLPGDLLVLFTDGVTEALNSEEEEFGEKKFIKTIMKSKGQSSEKIISNLLDKIREHSLGASQFDDITIISVSKNTP